MELIAKKWANEFRERFGLGSADPVQPSSLLLRLHINAFFTQIPQEISGMAIRIGESRFMLINTNHSLGRQHFTICHELYHLFIQQDFSSQICQTGKFNKKDKEEYLADRFAAFLLLPEDGLLDLIPPDELRARDRVSLATLLLLEHYFSSSRLALLYRLKDMKLISETYYETFSKQVKQSALQLGYPLSLYAPTNDQRVVGDYGALARELFTTGKISESHYVSLMGDIGVNVLQQFDGDAN